ncbi:MAG: heparan-alpha-glucosaminide N-acetyltransferase domain-containing protein, partial [Saprospiraceae bacterium]
LGIAGLAIIFGHNLLQGVSFAGQPAQFLWAVLFRLQLFSVTPNFTFMVLYPLIPWFGILLTGFAAGRLFELPLEKRKKIGLQIGGVALALFCLLRTFNFYGDPSPWSMQKTALFSFFSFINVSKYPPSLLFSLVTLGVMCIILSIADGVKNRFTDVFSTYGKVPLFYYLVHWYLVHSAMFAMVFLQGFTWADLEFGPFKFGRPATGAGLELPGVYLVWLGIVALLYPLCKWYGRYKSAHPEQWLLRYI